MLLIPARATIAVPKTHYKWDTTRRDFIAFISEMPEMLRNVCACAVYANDVKLYVIDDAYDELCLQMGINLLVGCSKQW